jgi:hypothetical protein
VVAGWHNGLFNARKQWGWPQYFRYWIFRLSLDFLMVLMVALCTVQRDFIHAAYLALTLWLFRRREELRKQGNKLFFWLPFANLCVIVLMLVFQAPWQELVAWWSHHGGDFWHSSAHHSLAGAHSFIRNAISAVTNMWLGTPAVVSWSKTFPGSTWGEELTYGRGDQEFAASHSPLHAGDHSECSWGHLLGLHRIMNAGRWKALELSPHGAGIPLLMWLAIQVRTLRRRCPDFASNEACSASFMPRFALAFVF